MNAVMPVVVEAPVDVSQFGEIQAAWQITPEALIILGWRQERSPTDGTVAHQQPGASKGRFHSVSWPLASAGGEANYFAAALQLPIGSGVRAGDTLLLTGKGEGSGVLARLPTRFMDAPTFGAELARVAAIHAIAVTRFLTHTFSPAATRGNADIRTLLYAFLERASSTDGCIEVAGAIEGHCVILQGWGAAPGPECDLIVIGAAIERHTPKLAVFARSDMRGTACGQVVVLPAAATSGVAQIEVIVVLDRRGLRWRPMVKDRRLLSGPETIGHLRTTLAGLQCDTATRSMLQASLRPRFEGRFNLYDGGHPVRLAVDLAAAGPDGGVYLTGWLYDPKAVVSAIHLCGRPGVSALLNTNWVRIVREDVTDAFANDPALPRNETGQHRHGFAVHVGNLNTAAAGEALYLDVSFQDGQCGFVPLTMAPADNQATQTRLLATVDLHKSSGVQIIEDHLAPFFLGLTGSVVAPETRMVAPVPSGWSCAIVVPLADATLPRALLSQFLHDSLRADEGLVFVCGDNWTATALDALRASAGFYGISPAVVRVTGSVGPVVALAAVAAVAQTDRLLLLAPGTVGRSKGWRRALHDALDAAGGLTCVSPTVVYEDESIRFGGTDGVEQLDTAPYVRIRRRLAGLPVSIIRVSAAEATATASPACCLMPSQAAGGCMTSTGMAATVSMQEVALSLMLESNGVASVWTPAAQVYAADAPTVTVHENTARVGQLVNGWCLRARLTAKE